MSLPPWTLTGTIDTAAGDLTRHFSLPVARLIATIWLAPVVASVGRYRVSAATATPWQPWRSLSRNDELHVGANAALESTCERTEPSAFSVEMFQCLWSESVM